MSTRTTLTLDDDVADRLASEARRTGSPLRAVVNAAIRRGLDRRDEVVPRFHVEATALRRRPGMDLDDVEGLLDRLDGPTRR